ncbi:ferritin-like domain-containing protein [Flaviaesturariibacter amylovorans]|uniref:Ferritin-like domain-containing protein n=1 Tax=Flaviaesturariibacter amylovorans TaxID=1084520 RepID=A0ABP8H4A0_9BACT
MAKNTRSASKTATKKSAPAKAAAKKAAPAKAAPKKAAAASNSRSANRGGAASFDEASLLRELFIEELRDIYWAEKHLTKALPKLRKAATNPELANAFETHLAQTEEQIGRVEEVFEMMGEAARAKKCEAMEGLVQEAQQGIEDTPKGSNVRDAALIICAQKVEHYEIAAYGSLVQLAKTLGENEVATLLAETLEEEKQTDELLTELAVSGINISASQESED